MRLLFASQNTNKLRELSAMLPEHTFVLPSELGITTFPKEKYQTFEQNALQKALSLHKISQGPVLAEDSGLCVLAMKEGPGIYSARYGGGKTLSQQTRRRRTSPLSDKEKNELLLEAMEAEEDRRALFVSCFVLVLAPYRRFVVQESIEGTITLVPRGENGFGYDPLFLTQTTGKTMAELSPSQKNSLSHRGLAAKRLHALLFSIEKD